MQPKGSYRLIMRQGPTPGKVFDLAKAVLTIGRDVSNDLVVSDAEVSRSHVRLTAKPDGYLAEDLASTNGTFVNGQRLTGLRMLRPGDIVGLGETVTLEFGHPGEETVVASELPPPTAAEPRAAPPRVTARPLRAPPAPPPRAAEPMPPPTPSTQPSRNIIPWVIAGCAFLTLCVCLIAGAIVVLRDPLLNLLR